MKGVTPLPTVLLIGCGPTALSALESLASSFTVLGVVRPSSDPTDEVVACASALGVPLFHDGSMETLERLVDELQPDCLVVSSYDRILGAALLGRLPCVNVHYSQLPRYRGRANVNWAILNGEPETAITIHVMAPGLDAGNVLWQETVTIGPRDDVGGIYARLNDLQRKALAPAVLALLAGEPGTPQDETQASWGCSRTQADGMIDWAAPTIAIDRLVRAVAPPFPGAFTHVQGHRLMIWRAEPLAAPLRYEGRVAGRVVARSKGEGWVDVLTGDGVLRLHEVQPEHGLRQPAAKVLYSTKIKLGLQLPDMMELIHQLEVEVINLRTQTSAPLQDI